MAKGSFADMLLLGKLLGLIGLMTVLCAKA